MSQVEQVVPSRTRDLEASQLVHLVSVLWQLRQGCEHGLQLSPVLIAKLPSGHFTQLPPFL